jgi:DNA-binding response OmpR family regulator
MVLSSNEEDHRDLRNIFNHSKWHIHVAQGWGDARPYLERHRISVVICDHDVPGGGWRGVLGSLSEIEDAPLLIVTSRLADDFLWAEVLNLGGYDVLMKPFDPSEVYRVVCLAWMNWKELRDRKRRLQAGYSPFAAAS